MTEDAFVGEIRLFAGNYEPGGWCLCDGRLLPVRAFGTLFELLGTRFGGDGKDSFAVPDLMRRAPRDEWDSWAAPARPRWLIATEGQFPTPGGVEPRPRRRLEDDEWWAEFNR